MCLDQPIDFLQIPITVTFKFGEITASMKGKWIWNHPNPCKTKYSLVSSMWLIDLSILLGENRKESQILTCQTLYSSRRMQKIIKTKIRFVGKSNILSHNPSPFRGGENYIFSGYGDVNILMIMKFSVLNSILEISKIMLIPPRFHQKNQMNLLN